MNNGRLNDWIGIEEEQRWDREGYPNSWEHYADELGLLDCRLQLLYHKGKKRMAEWLADPFNAMFVSEEEFMGLISGSSAKFDFQRQDEEAALLLEQIQAREYAIAGRLALSEKAGVYLPLPFAARIFRMQTWERDCLMVALAVELDRKYERIFGYLIDDLTCKQPNVSLLLQLTCRSVAEMSQARASLSASGKLARYFLNKDESAGTPRPLLSRLVVLDPRMVRFLLGEAAMEPDEAVDRVTQRIGLQEPLEPLRTGAEQQHRLCAGDVRA